MGTIKIGSKVLYKGEFGRGVATEVKVEGMELVPDGEKYGTPISEIDFSRKNNVVFDLDNGHWCYGSQVVKLIQ